MRKTNLHLFYILSILIFIAVNVCVPQTRTLQEDKTVKIFKNETVMLETGVLGKNITSVNYELAGDILQLIYEDTENPEEGYEYYFQAIKSGEARITLHIGSSGNEVKEIIQKKFYKVEVINDSGLAKINAAELYNNPENYTDGLFILEGKCRGWGSPVNTSVVWGKMVTRSDWVFEDGTGALYVTGGEIFGINKDEEIKVKVIGFIELDANNEWAFYGYKVTVISDAEITKVNAADINSKPGNYTNGIFMLEGTSRGWGFPVNTSVVWGKMVTRSDWVFEDNTGALYITGIFKIEKGTEVKISGTVVLDENSNEWTFYGREVILK
jgi:hypothetical protein